MPTCPSCGEENPDRFRFCGVCGTALAGEEQTSTAEERKVVSVLFVDLVGFTARSDRADPEDVRATLRPYHAMLKREIERFGGTVEKFIGDAVMAVFGAPVAHEDDAERAVRTALRITERIPELSEANAALELQVRAAVNTGETVVTLGAHPEKGEGIVTGDVVNTASRLQQVAPVGGVVVGEMTYRTTGDAIEYRALEPVQVKGKADPVPLWQAMGARSRYIVEVERAPTPFIGREDDLALLQQTFSRTLRESLVQLVTVTGEPGVGKSRLIGEFFSWIDDRPELIAWRQGRCLSYGEGITFWALGEMVKAQAGILDSDGPDEASAKLSVAVDAVVEEAPERDWVKGRLAPLIGTSRDVGAAADRAESFAAWRTFLEGIASTGPLILVVEDLHWADDAMFEFVEHLVDWATGVPLLVICSARPELFERDPGWGGGKRNSTTISLSPLTSEETSRLLVALLSEAVLPAETQAALLERAGGNPLYAEEFVRMLTDRGILERKGHALRFAPGSEISVPETVQALITARLDTLASERKSLLHDAAVVGKVFWSGALSFMSELEEGAVREGLHELARKELVRPARRSSMEGQSEYAFWHILVRDVAYGQIPRSARAEKHRRAARWIEEIAGERIADMAELLAYHYGLALELSRAAGSTDQTRELEEVARRFLVLAGDRAVQLDVAIAESYYAQALALFPSGDHGRPAVASKAAEAAFRAGRYPEAQQLSEEAIEGLRDQGDLLGAGDALSRLSNILWYRGDTSGAREAALRAVEMLDRETPGPELAYAYTRVGSGYALGGHAEESLDWLERGLALSRRLGLDDIAMVALQYQGGVRFDLGDLDGLNDLREALRLGSDLGLSSETGVAYNNLGSAMWFADGPARALENAQEGIAFSERRGLARQVMWTTAETLWLLYDLGRWDELLPVADRLIEWDRDRGGSQIGVIALSYKAQVLVRRGDVAGARELVERFLQPSRDIADPQVLVPSLVIAALIEEALGRTSEAIALLEELREAGRDVRGPYASLLLPDALRICVAAARLDLGQTLVEGADPNLPRMRHSVVSGRAILAEAAGDLEEASAGYGEAVRAWSEYGHVPEQGQALLGAGRCLLRMGSSVEARARLTEAREFFAGLGARPLVAETDSLLREATALSS